MEKYNIWVGSILITALTMEMLLSLVDYGNHSGISRIRYFDNELQKDVFIFFRYDQKCCICGDASRMKECSEYYLIPHKKIQEIKLFPVSRNANADLHINYKRVMVQAANGEFVMDNVLDKVRDELQSQNISQSKLDETNIYIKPSDRKVYYVVPDEVTGSVEL